MRPLPHVRAAKYLCRGHLPKENSISTSESKQETWYQARLVGYFPSRTGRHATKDFCGGVQTRSGVGGFIAVGLAYNDR